MCMHIYSTIRKTQSLNKKINMHAYKINMHRIALNMHKVILLQMVPHNNPFSFVLRDPT